MEPDPLHEYRITKLEEAVSSLSASMADIADTVKGARWAVLLIFGVMQPVVIALLIKAAMFIGFNEGSG